MQPFRFRAAAALIMRRKQEDAARHDLAVAEAARKSAEKRAAAAAAAGEDARGAAVEACRQGTDGWQLEWHRSWIAKLRIEAETERRAAAASAESVARAAATVRLAHQRRRALERLRDKAWHRHRLEAGRQEMRAMNELATLKHHARPEEE